MYDIEKGVEITNAAGARGGPVKYPFASMEVGDSFFVPAGNRNEVDLRNSIGGAGRRHFGRGGVVTTIREENGVRGVRVWRKK